MSRGFGVELRRLRVREKLTQRQLAELLGVTNSYLSKLETGEGSPGEELVRGIAEQLAGDEEMLLVLAGKVPPALAERAGQDEEFARFLRLLPNVSEDGLGICYAAALYHQVPPR